MSMSDSDDECMPPATVPLTPTQRQAQGESAAAAAPSPAKVSAATAAAIAASAAVRAAAAGAPTPASIDRSSGLWSSLLQRSYNPPFISPCASIVHHSGSLRKFGSKLTTSSLNGRHFALVHHSLQYFKGDPWAKPQGGLSLLGAVLTAEPDSEAAALRPSPPPHCCFSLLPRGSTRKYVFVCDDTEQRDVWLDVLGASVDEKRRAALAPRAAEHWADDSNLLVEGWVHKLGAEVKAQSWKRRYLVYNRASHSLSYFKSTPPRAAGTVPIGERGAAVVVDVVGGSGSGAGASAAALELQKYSDKALSSLPGGVDASTAFSCTASEERCYVMLGASRADRDEWVSALRGAIAYAEGKGATSWEPSRVKQARAAAAAVAASGSSSAKASNALAAAAAAATASSSASPSASATTPASTTSSAAGGAAAEPAAASNPATPASPSVSSSGPPSKPPPALSSASSSPQLKPATASPQMRPLPALASPTAAATASSSDAPAAAPAATASAPASSPASASPVGSDDDDSWDHTAVTGARSSRGQSVSYVSLAAAGLVLGSSKPGTKSASAASAAGLGAVREGDDSGDEEDEQQAEEENASTPRSSVSPAVAPSSATPLRACPASPSSSSSSSAPAATATTPSRASAASSSSTRGTSDASLVEKSLSELYSTEQTYVGILRTICSSYLLRLRRYHELRLEPRWFEEGELEALAIFQHVASIRDINSRLLKELEDIGVPSAVAPVATTNAEGGSAAATPTAAAASAAAAAPSIPASPAAAAAAAATPAPSSSTTAPPPAIGLQQRLARIGRTFRQYIPYFKVYSNYAKSYEDVRALEGLAEKRQGLRNFLALTEACEGASLASLMITPVQRVGRYVMLLETILKHAPRDDPAAAGNGGADGLADVELALAEMKKVAALINSTVALWEATSKVVELQSKLDGGPAILRPGRFLVREGVLRKLYRRDAAGNGFFASLARKEAPFHFFLLNDALLQAKKNALQDKYTLRATIPLHDMVLEDLPDSDGVKCAWQLTYAVAAGTAGAAAAGAAATAGATTPASATRSAAESHAGEGDALQPNPVATDAPQQPMHMDRALSLDGDSAASPSASTPSGSAGAGGFKSVTLYARDSDEKRKWMSDIASLIEQNKQKTKTLMSVK